MAKKTAEKDKKRRKKAETRGNERPSETHEDKDDFGGIPARDIKKNLGCGG